MLVIVNAVPVGLESVTAWAAPVVPTFWFPKSGTGDGERAGRDTPVPDTPAVCGVLLALSVTVNVALRVGRAVWGEGTLMAEVAVSVKDEGLRGQLLVCPKSPGLVPVKPMLVMVSAVAVGFESVTA